VEVKATKAVMKAAEVKAKAKAWSFAESTALLLKSVGASCEALVVLGLYGGLRPGEAEALLWEDFDWLEGTVTVSRTVTKSGGKVFAVDSPKSGSSRTVKLPFDAVQRLVRLQEAQPEGTVKVYSVTSHQQAGRQLAALCKKAGVPALSPHSLRHTFASVALSRGVKLPAVSKMLGHANTRVTLDVYTHLMAEDLDDVVGIMESAYLPHTTPHKKVPAIEEIAADQGGHR
jgi:integrase